MTADIEEVMWHPTQQCTLLEDAGLRFEVDVDGLEEISWWVLGYGREAVVEKPVALRRLVLAHAQSMVEHYAEASILYS